MRRILIVGVAVLALAAGFLIRPRDEHREARATRGAAAANEATQVTVPGDPEPDEPGDGDGADDVVWIDLRGTAVVVDEDGRHLAGESGTFETESFGTFEVTRGDWEATIPLRPSLTVEEAVFGGREAIPDPATVDIPEDRVVEARFRWFVPARLRVLGEKGEDLDGVELVKRMYGEIVPPDGEEAIDAGRSPVTIPGKEAGLRKYWVRARGHAWSRIAVWQGHGGERVVRLARAGAIEARLLPPDPQVKLHVYRSGDHVLERWADESGFCRIDGLPPGRLELRAEAECWLNEPVMATAEIEIEPGKTTEVSLPLRDRIPESVRVAGTLRVGPGWPEEEAIEITADGGLGPEVEILEGGGWSVDLVPGEHCLTVTPWVWTQAIEVGPRGATDVRLVVPPRCDVEVRLVDAVTGDPIPDEDDLYWHVKSGKFDSRYLDDRAQPCTEPGVWRFPAPVGTLVLWLWNDLHDAGFEEFELKPGKNRIELKAVPNFACDLAIKDGATPVPVDEEMERGLRATTLGGDGKIDSCRNDFPSRIWFTKAGRYRISLPLIEGYEPVESFEVEIAAGTVPRIEIALKRR